MTSVRSWTWNTEANVLKSVHIRQREELQWNSISEQYTYYCVFVNIYIYIWLYVHILHNTQIYCIYIYMQIFKKNANYVGVSGSTWSQHEPQKQIKLPTSGLSHLLEQMQGKLPLQWLLTGADAWIKADDIRTNPRASNPHVFVWIVLKFEHPKTTSKRYGDMVQNQNAQELP